MHIHPQLTRITRSAITSEAWGNWTRPRDAYTEPAFIDVELTMRKTMCDCGVQTRAVRITEIDEEVIGYGAAS